MVEIGKFNIEYFLARGKFAFSVRTFRLSSAANHLSVPYGVFFRQLYRLLFHASCPKCFSFVAHAQTSNHKLMLAQEAPVRLFSQSQDFPSW